MPLHIYGIIDASQLRGDIPQGHEGDPVKTLFVEGLSVVISSSTSALSAVSVEPVLHHEKIMKTLMQHHTVLPMRFGMVCEPDNLIALVKKRLAAIRENLQELSGKREMALRISIANPVKPQTKTMNASVSGERGSGKDYLMKRIEEDQNHRQIRKKLKEIQSVIDVAAARFIWLNTSELTEPFKASCLVDLNQIGAFLTTVKSLEDHNLQISCTGPWAPYSFVSPQAALGAINE